MFLPGRDKGPLYILFVEIARGGCVGAEELSLSPRAGFPGDNSENVETDSVILERNLGRVPGE